jgi:hypothetical protein
MTSFSIIWIICEATLIIIVSNNTIYYTQASLNTKRYKCRDSASGLSRKLSVLPTPSSWTWSNFRCCSLIGRVNYHERSDESNVQGEYNDGVPGRREQPNQWPLASLAYHRIQHSDRPDLHKKHRKKSSIVGPTIEPAKQPSSSNEFQNCKLTRISPSTPTYILILHSYKLKTRRMPLIH